MSTTKYLTSLTNAYNNLNSKDSKVISIEINLIVKQQIEITRHAFESHRREVVQLRWLKC